MLNREQWEALARFAGGKFINDRVLGPTFDYRSKRGGGYMSPWQPLTDWRDFGPLWRLLKHWLAQYPKDRSFPHAVRIAYWQFEQAENKGTEQELMQAGCELGAAIGATMKQEGA